jgi:hypothetical protein
MSDFGRSMTPVRSRKSCRIVHRIYASRKRLDFRRFYSDAKLVIFASRTPNPAGEQAFA